MNSIFTDYLLLLDDTSAAEQTYRNNRRSFDLFSQWLDGRDPMSLTPNDMREFWRSLTRMFKETTAAKHIINVRAAYKHAHELGVIDCNPTAGIEKILPSPVDVLPETYSADDLRRMHAAIETDREDAVFHLHVFSGGRAAELRHLRWLKHGGSFVDLDNAQLVIDGKGNKIRFVPLHPILQAKLEAAPKNGRCVVESSRRNAMHHSTWSGVIADLMERADVTPKSKKGHIFRKTLATNLNQQGVKQNVLDTVFGWAKTTVFSRHYAGVAPDETRAAIALAYRNDPIMPGIEPVAAMSEDHLLRMMELLKSQIEVLQAQKSSSPARV